MDCSTRCHPERQCRGVLAATLDEVATNPAAIPLVDDGETHHVRITLGRTSRGAGNLGLTEAAAPARA